MVKYSKKGGVNMDDKQTQEYFEEYYSDYTKETSKLFFKKIQEALVEISKTHGLMEINDAYRSISYLGTKVVYSSLGKKPETECSLEINEKAVKLVDTLVNDLREHPQGREMLYVLPLVMMDVIAFKDFEYSKTKDKESEDDK